jgi:hypothetical protein
VKQDENKRTKGDQVFSLSNYLVSSSLGRVALRHSEIVSQREPGLCLQIDIPLDLYVAPNSSRQVTSYKDKPLFSFLHVFPSIPLHLLSPNSQLINNYGASPNPEFAAGAPILYPFTQQITVLPPPHQPVTRSPFSHCFPFLTSTHVPP